MDIENEIEPHDLEDIHSRVEAAKARPDADPQKNASEDDILEEEGAE
ncbi:hypothetical protein [Salipiger sp. IMCC34102]|nr:hypothetical protein [Salipiger sp. IMCC34102]